MNSSGAKIDHYGTPLETGVQLNLFLFIWTHYLWFHSQASIHLITCSYLRLQHWVITLQYITFPSCFIAHLLYFGSDLQRSSSILFSPVLVLTLFLTLPYPDALFLADFFLSFQLVSFQVLPFPSPTSVFSPLSLFSHVHTVSISVTFSLVSLSRHHLATSSLD